MKCTRSLVNWTLKIKTSTRKKKENKDFKENLNSKEQNS